MCALQQPFTSSLLIQRKQALYSNVPLETRYHWRPAVASIGIGTGFFFLAALFDIVLERHGIGAPAILLGDLLGGVVAGLLVLWYERRRHRELVRRLDIIRLMNHHVRNSLQVIAY